MTTPGTTTVGGVAIVAPQTGLSSGASTNPYGLDSPDGVFTPGALGTVLGVPTDGNGQTTAAQFLAAFSSAPPTVKAQIQAQLVNAGYYGSSPSLTYGVVSDSDLKALVKALNVANQMQTGVNQANTQTTQAAEASGAKPPAGQSFDFSATLSSDAARGQAYGVQAAISGRLTKIQQQQATSAQQVLSRTSYDRDYINNIVDTAAEHLLGKKASDADKDAIYGQVGAKANVGLAKAQQKASELDSLAAETATANQRLTATLGATAGGSFDTGKEAVPPGMTPIQAQQFREGNAAPDANIDQFLTAFSATAHDSSNPYGFTATSWSTYARASGLGADADPTNPANQRVVAKWLAVNLLAKYGSWGAVTAGFLAGPSAAASYARDPDSPAWLNTTSAGTSLAGRINAISQNLPATSLADTTSSLPGQIAPGSVVGPTSTALGDQPLSAQPTVVDQVTQDPGSSAEAELKKAHPDEYQAHSIANVFSSFLGLLGGLGAGNTSSYGQGGAPA